MESATIHYFSGTGNTARAAELIAAELRTAGFAVTIHRVTSANLQSDARNLQSPDLTVVAFPIYACGIPSIMTRFLRSLPRRGSPAPRAAVVCTMGDLISYDRRNKRHHVPGFEGHALMQAAGLLSQRGYDVFVTGACSYPLNWTQAVNAPKPAIDAELRELGDGHATEIGRRVAAGEHSIRGFGLAHALWTVPFDLLFRIFGRVGLGKLYVADSDCNACGQCVRDCPARAIRLVRERPRWNWSCEACQRCINTCPKKAIQTSWARLGAELVHMLIPIPLLIWRFGPHPWIPVRPVVFEVFFWLGVYAVFTWLLDEFILLLGLIPGVRRIVEWNSTKRLRRYLEQHFRQ
jgi:NAD-dependent dihydropyrimidine dehydrogenase PreA subunit/flavodoxin